MRRCASGASRSRRRRVAGAGGRRAAPFAPLTSARRPPPQSYYASLEQGIKTGSLEGAGGASRVCVVDAIDAGHLVGAIVAHSLPLAEARKRAQESAGKGGLAFDLLDAPAPGAAAAYVMQLGVLPAYRRRGIAKELVFEALRRMIEEDPKIDVAFAHALAEDEGAVAFLDDAGFSKFGLVRGHFHVKDADTGDDVAADAIVFARPFHDAELARYAKPAGAELVDLSAPGLAKVRRAPKWAVNCGLQFILPLAIVAALFGVSYVLVLLGPLRGISGRTGVGAVPDAAGDDLDPSTPEL